MSLVLKNLFIGNIEDAANKSFLESNHVNLVINCCKEYTVDYNYLKTINIACVMLGYFDSLEQDLNEQDKLLSAVKFIDEHLTNDRGGVLVHCVAGVSRSASVVIAYLMWKNKMNFESAFRIVRQGRPIVEPNSNFVNQLKSFEKLLSI